MDTNRYKIELDGGDFFDEDNLPQEPKTQAEKRMEILYEILDDMKLRAEQDPNANISLDDYKDKLPKTIKNDIWLTFDDLLYPKSQLDAIFNPTQTTTETNTLQTQLDQAHARIAELERQLDDKELSTRSQNTVGTIIAGLANLANIDLKSHYGGDSNKKIRQELLKLGFKASDKDGLPLSDGTVATWLKIADDLSK